MLVFSPFAARAAPHPHTALVKAEHAEAQQQRTGFDDAAAPSCPADRHSLASDHTGFDARRAEATVGQLGLQVRLSASHAVVGGPAWDCLTLLNV